MIKNLGSGIAFAVLLFLPLHGGAQCVSHAELNAYERSEFIAGYYGQRDQIYAQLLAAKGCERVMLDRLRQFGAGIRYFNEKVGFAIVILPKEKFLDVLDIPGVGYAFPSTREDNYPDANSSLGIDGKLAPVPLISIPIPRVTTKLFKGGPYFAAHEIGLDALWQRHPEADGRGVTVAVLDEGLDLLHPALRQAKGASGKIVPKIVDQVAYTTPEDDKNWVEFGEPIETQHGTFEAAGRTWTAPDDGIYRFGAFRQELVLGPERNSHTKRLPIAVGVLWDEKNNHVWVDTNGDGSFKDQRALSDFAMAHDIDWFGTKEGEDDNRIPFGVKIDHTRHAVYITIASGGHGAGIVGSLAANRLTGGLYNGAAPSAQLLDARFNLLSILVSILEMEGREDVALINRSGGIATGDKDSIGEFQRRVLERAVAVYGKPIVCFCTAENLIYVDDYVSGEMLRRNRQTSSPYLETANPVISGVEDAGLVNSILAPSAQLNTESRYMPFGLVFADGKRHTWADDQLDPPAPAGYWIGANESPTIPVVSGVLADLISGAKNEHVRYSASRLDQAVFASTRIIAGTPIYQQGYGLINAAHAWDQLTEMAKADDPENSTLTSFTVSEIQADKRKDINGFYREATTPGGKLDGEVWITRRGGYAGGRPYLLKLRGDDGTYVLSDTSVKLVRDEPLKIRFKANLTSGYHVAFIELIDKEAKAVMYQLPLSLKVADTPNAIRTGVERYSASIAPRHTDTRFISVGEEIQAIRYEARIPYDGSGNSSIVSMPGFDDRGVKPPAGEPVDTIHHVGPMQSLESLAAIKEPGIQEMLWENRGLHAEYETPYESPAPTVAIDGTVTVTKYAVAFTESSDRKLTITNKLADVEGKVELYDATLNTSQLAGTGLHASGELERRLPANLTQWRVRVTATLALDERADAYLLNCSKKSGCYVTAQQKITVSGKTVTIDKPQGGAWKIVICSRGHVSHPLTYVVDEALLVQTRTPIEPDDSKHPNGAVWTLSLPMKQSDTQYAAFRIDGTPGNEREKNGLLIAMTPLDGNAP